VDNINSTV